MKYLDHGTYIELCVPDDFSFDQCLVYLGRSDIECLHRVINGALFKVLEMNQQMLMIKASAADKGLRIDFLNLHPEKEHKDFLADYMWTYFDMDTDIRPFYEMAERDPILSKLIENYKGLRIVKINDVYEGLCWAVIGQQINLKFAYTLKQRLCQSYGRGYEYDGHMYYVFPEPESIADLDVSDLRQLQFTGRKSEYLIGISKLFESGALSQKVLEGFTDFQELQKHLISIRGVGKWTADYTILKCFSFHNAFPIADVGIHNGMKSILGREKKPSVEEIIQLAVPWAGWEAYATFYIWRSLYE